MKESKPEIVKQCTKPGFNITKMIHLFSDTFDFQLILGDKNCLNEILLHFSGH